MHKLSVVLITHNSEKHLREVLASASFADEILLLDSGSEDDTLLIAETHGCRIERQKNWLGFGRQKQRAVDLATHSWIFVLDSDEVISEELKNEIVTLLSGEPTHQGYLVPRVNWFFGKPIYHGGLYPDRTLRLFDRRHGRFTEDEVHEKVVVNGTTGILKHPMKHYAYDSVEQFIDKQNRYSSLGARPNRLKALLNPLWTFIRVYLVKGGFLDGWHGYTVARLYAQYTFWKYIKK